jgi:hypothetical protein
VWLQKVTNGGKVSSQGTADTDGAQAGQVTGFEVDSRPLDGRSELHRGVEKQPLDISRVDPPLLDRVGFTIARHLTDSINP